MSVVNKVDNIFANEHQAYAHGVSCEGKMGAGIAKDFARHFPEMFATYQNQCRTGKLTPGGVFLYEGKPFIFNLATQETTRRATYPLLEESMGLTYAIARQRNITDIAMPRIGCGRGGLTQKDLMRALSETFMQDSTHHVTIYEQLMLPAERSSRENSRRNLVVVSEH